MGRNRTGAAGDDVVLKVPQGTQILSDDRETVLADLVEPGQRIMLLKGGDGGKGNAHFKTSTNRAPRKIIPGFPGEDLWIWLRLKLLADAGLLGLPNAGKSTFLNRVTNASAKVGDYPFTTLKPQLGVVSHKGQEFVLADIPGLIAGAAEGVGIGDRFLGHIERCRVLLHLVDGACPSPTDAYRTVRTELDSYGGGLDQKPEVVALTKVDTMTARQRTARLRALEAACGQPVIALSSATGEGLAVCLDHLLETVQQSRGAPREATAAAWSPL